jgi:hypothetical protein
MEKEADQAFMGSFTRYVRGAIEERFGGHVENQGKRRYGSVPQASGSSDSNEVRLNVGQKENHRVFRTEADFELYYMFSSATFSLSLKTIFASALASIAIRDTMAEQEQAPRSPHLVTRVFIILFLLVKFQPVCDRRWGNSIEEVTEVLCRRTVVRTSPHDRRYSKVKAANS